MNKNAWLAFSTAVNVILLSVLLTFTFNKATQPAPQSAAAPRPRAVAAERKTQLPSATTADEGPAKSDKADALTLFAPAAGGQPVSFTLVSGRTIQFPADFVSLVKRLQAAGVSAELLASFVQAEFSRQWSIAQQEIQRKIRRGEIDQGEQTRFYADLQNLQKEAVKSLLGEEAYARVEKQAAVRWAESSGLTLTPEQALAAYQIARESGQGGRRGQDLSAAFQAGEIDQWDYQEQQAALQKELEQQMTALIGADGVAEFKRNNDWNYGRFRRQVRDLNLPDAQVDALYSAMQQYGQKQQELQRLNQAGKLQPQEFSQQYSALNNEREQEIQRILGADGQAQYQKVTDSRYQQLKQYATAWQLTPSDIDHVYQSVTQAMQAVDDYRKQAQTAGQGQPVNWQEIQKATDDYKRQAEDELRQYLGEERFNKLKRAGVIQMNYRTSSSMYYSPSIIYYPGY